ncbi:MAG TPA: hypothetical protein PL001_01150, partial [Candidatus Kryptobacter bacterium]|nr:hypothetical protein [Candidatus Kryptobacter bacterium]
MTYSFRKILFSIIALCLISVSADAACALKSGNIYTCLSSDTKPNAQDGTRLYETDTLKGYLRMSGAWSALTIGGDVTL